MSRVRHNIPICSIIIPVRNEEKNICKCLDAILATDFPKQKIEILIIDGESSDNTLNEVMKYIKTHPEIDIKILNNPQKITPVAFNIGIKHAKGEFIAFIGAHNFISSNYLSVGIKQLQKEGADCVGGRGICIPTSSESLIAKSIAIVINNKFGTGSSFRTKNLAKAQNVDTVPSPIYRKEVFTKIGLFDEELIRGQDAEYNLRLIKSGGKILLVPEIVSYYYARDTLKKLWNMYYQYGYFKPLIALKVGRVLTWRQLIPGLFIGSLIATLLLSLIIKPFLWLFLLILFSYITANLTFSLFLSIKKGLKFFPVLPIVFAALHFSYGIGYIRGVIDFICLKKHKKKKIEDVPLTR